MKKMNLKQKYLSTRECLDTEMKNPRFKKAWDDLEVEFSIINTILKKRIQKGITQKELADRIGTDQATLSRLESGNYNPTIRYLKRVAKALDVELRVTMV